MSDGLHHELKGKLLEICQSAWDQVEIDQKFKIEEFFDNLVERQERNKKIKEQVDKDLNN